MLNILLRNDLCQVLVVVTRYFGGILLGTGGLVKAYSDASIQAIEKAKEVAKGLVKRDGLAEHLGEKVNYNPPAGGTWRIFYYDNEDQGNGKGYFGDPVGTVYLRRVTDSIPSDIMESLDSERESHMLDNLNPIMEGNWVTGTSGFKWATGFADPSLWSNYCDQTSSRYAVGAPSFEMLWKIIEVIERCKW